MKRRVYIPLGEQPGTPMSAPALRRYEVGIALAQEYDVVFGVGPGMDEGDCGGGARCVQIKNAAAQRAQLMKADVFYTLGIQPRDYIDISRSGVRVIVDAYCPRPFETLEASPHLDPALVHKEHRRDIYWSRVSLQLADLLICNSVYQRDFWIGFMIAHGLIDALQARRDPFLDCRVGIVPHGVPSGMRRVRRQGDELGPLRLKYGWSKQDVVMLWSSRVLAWQDPITLMKAVKIVVARDPSYRLVLLGTGKLPKANDAVDGGAFRSREAVAAARATGLLGTHIIFAEERIEPAELPQYYADADFAVGAYPRSLETHYCLATRFMDYAGMGLPFVTTGMSAQRDLATATGGGICVAPEDASGLANAMLTMGSPQARVTYARSLADSAHRFLWTDCIAPVASWIRELPACRKGRLSRVRSICRIARFRWLDARFRLALRGAAR